MKNKEKLLRFAFANHQWRDSTMGTEIPIWAQGNFTPARVRLIRGKTEILAGMGIVRELDIAVRFCGDQFKVGQIEWGMMTFNEKRHLGIFFSSTFLRMR